MRPFCQKLLAIACCYLLATPLVWPQVQQQLRSIEPEKPRSPIFVRPYQAPFVPPVRLSDSARIQSLIRAGKMYLTVQDAIALALENNIDIEVARYQPLIDQWNLTLYQAGGALPGVPTGSSQISSGASGQGVNGAQSSSGFNVSAPSNIGNAGTTTTVSQIGEVTPVLDPVFQESTAFTHQSQPQYYLAQTGGVANLISGGRSYSASLSQGLITGGQVTVSYSNSYLNQPVATNELNPSYANSASISINHNFLAGFGVAVNARNITIAENTLNTSDIAFKATLIPIIATVLSDYYTLAADFEDVKAKRSALDVAQRFYENNKKQVELGTLAPLDVTTAESQVASSDEALVVSETTLQQQEVALKNVISRRGLADPVLEETEIIPIDRIEVPKEDSLPPLNKLVSQALANRTDIAEEKINLENTKISNLNTQNAVLPTLVGFSTLRNSGAAGTPTHPGVDPYFIGGVDTALGQIVRNNFPSRNVGVFFGANPRNRQAQADYGIDQYSYRQQQLQNAKDTNQVVVDVSNQVIALRQARAKYEAAVQSRILEQQLLDAEEKKFSLGASTTFLVVQQQRDLATAQSAEIAALVQYSNARVALDQALGTTLEASHISLQEALSGRVARPSSVPANVPAQP